MEDLEEAIRKARQAVDITPQGHPNLAGRLNNLGHRLCLSSHSIHRDEALNTFRESWRCLSGMPFDRLGSAIQAIQLLKQQQSWSEASAIAKEAVHFLPLVNSRSLSREDQQHVVSRFSGLAANACSLSLQDGDDAFEALELLELGRGVIIGLLIDDRSDISGLELPHSEMAVTYDRLRTEVNAPMHEVRDPNLRQDQITRHLEAVNELEDCVRSIRQLPGHERFLLGPTPEELKGLASDGPIVVVNVTDIRSDAIIVTSSTVESAMLPELTLIEAIEWIREGLTVHQRQDTPADQGRKNRRYLEFLLWLWSKCVEMVLQRIYNGGEPTAGNLPRIWWIGVGIANYRGGGVEMSRHLSGPQ
jgi:hypothetical protein